MLGLDKEWEALEASGSYAKFHEMSHLLKLSLFLQGASTVIQNLFGGQYVSQLKVAGAPQSDTMQPFTLLTLDILSDSVRTLSDAITNFTRGNPLEGAH